MHKQSKYLSLVALILLITNITFSCNKKEESDTSRQEERNTPNEKIGKRDTTASTAALANYEWTAFHGPDRRNKSMETGLLKSWPEGGPDLLWSVSGLGKGYASISIADGLIYTAGSDADFTYVFAYDLNGNLVWKKANGKTWEVEVAVARGYDGPRSTPTYDNGVVYHLSERNKLTAYKSENGETLWTRDLMKDFDAEMPIYGFTESVLIDGDNLYTRPAGGKGFQVCLNKTTGETVWVNNDIPGKYTYNSPVLHDFGGYRQLISASSSCYYGVDTKTGKLLWKVDFENQYGLNCVDAIPHNDQVFMSNGAGGGSMLIKLIASGDKITTEKVWFTDLMDNYHGGVLYHDGYFYGSGDRKRGWYAIESTSGEIVWSGPKRTGSLTYADGMLYLYNDNGSMLLIKASPDQYEETGTMQIEGPGPGPHWAHPVVCGGRLYVRYVDELFVYDVKQ